VLVVNLQGIPMTLVKFLSTGFCLGLLPKAPGTFGSLLGLFAAATLFRGNLIYDGLVLLTLTTLSVIIISRYEKQAKTHDSSEIVLDEVVGQMLTLLLVPVSWKYYLVGFLLFRFFDIFKPLGIRWIDQNVKGAVGTVLDDLLAGLLAMVSLLILVRFVEPLL